jgi:hypothetical protein
MSAVTSLQAASTSPVGTVDAFKTLNVLCQRDPKTKELTAEPSPGSLAQVIICFLKRVEKALGEPEVPRFTKHGNVFVPHGIAAKQCFSSMWDKLVKAHILDDTTGMLIEPYRSCQKSIDGIRHFVGECRAYNAALMAGIRVHHEAESAALDNTPFIREKRARAAAAAAEKAARSGGRPPVVPTRE